MGDQHAFITFERRRWGVETTCRQLKSGQARFGRRTCNVGKSHAADRYVGAKRGTHGDTEGIAHLFSVEGWLEVHRQ